MQLMPDADEENIQAAGDLFNTYCDEFERAKGDADKAFEKYFAPRVFGCHTVLYPVYKCNCSQEKIDAVVLPLGKAELLRIVEAQGVLSVHCDYCNKDYVYDRKTIEERFK